VGEFIAEECGEPSGDRGMVAPPAMCPLLVDAGGSGAPSIMLDMSIATLGLISGGSRFESEPVRAPARVPFMPFICSMDI
jgi:hypothetical protein